MDDAYMKIFLGHSHYRSIKELDHKNFHEKLLGLAGEENRKNALMTIISENEYGEEVKMLANNKLQTINEEKIYPELDCIYNEQLKCYLISLKEKLYCR